MSAASTTLPAPGATLASFLQEQRRASALTYREVATKAGLDVMTVWSTLNGQRRNPEAGTLVRLARGLDVSPAALGGLAVGALANDSET